MNRLLAYAITVFMMLASGRASAQVEKNAWLRIRFDENWDAHGPRDEIRMDLTLPGKPHSWEPIAAALGAMFHCPNGKPVIQKFPVPYGPRSREVSDANAKVFAGTCRGIEVHQGMARTNWDVAPLLAALSAIDGRTFDALTVSVDFPAAPFTDLHVEGIKVESERPVELDGRAYAACTIPIGKPVAIGPIQIAYGFPTRVLLAPALVTLGFVVLPIGMILWMRRASLRSGSEDPRTAWFSYQRTASQCVSGTVLLWVISDFNARHRVNAFMDFRFGSASGWPPLIAVALVFVPVLLVYAVKVLASYAVFVRFKGQRMTLLEYAAVELALTGVLLLPILFLTAAFSMPAHDKLELLCILLAGAVFVLLIARRQRVFKPQALTTGELRDRIFDLAKRATVALQQVFVLSAGKGQIANAFAARNNMVMFTDYLLQKVTRREVDYVAAHELTHLRLRHPTKLGAALVAAVLTPYWFPWLLETAGALTFMAMLAARPKQLAEWPFHLVKAWQILESWGIPTFVLILAGMSGFYFLARRFEYAADAGAVALTEDPEAAITGLLKLNQLNLTPLQWGKISGAWITHPSTRHRVERIAGVAGLAPGRLQELLDRYASNDSETAAEDHYPVPAPPAEVLPNSGLADRALVNFLVSSALQWLSALGTALLVRWAHSEGNIKIVAYLFGGIVTVAIHYLVRRWLPLRARRHMEDKLIEQARAEGIPLEQFPHQTIGLSPGATLRFYFASFNWDTGLLFLTRDKLYYVGSRVRWALSRDQVLALCEGPGAPDWRPLPRLYIRWSVPETGQQGVLNLFSAQPCSLWGMRECGSALMAELMAWQQGQVQNPSMAELEKLGAPEMGEVKSFPAQHLFTIRKMLRVLFTITIPCALVACSLTGGELDFTLYLYVMSVCLLTSIFQGMPYWWYGERPVFPAART